MIGKNNLLKDRRRQLNICLCKLNLNLLKLIAWSGGRHQRGFSSLHSQCKGWASQVGREIVVILSLATAGHWALKMGLTVQTPVIESIKSLHIDPISIFCADCCMCVTCNRNTLHTECGSFAKYRTFQLQPSSGRMEMNKQVTEESY